MDVTPLTILVNRREWCVGATRAASRLLLFGLFASGAPRVLLDLSEYLFPGGVSILSTQLTRFVVVHSISPIVEVEVVAYVVSKPLLSLSSISGRAS